MFIYESLVISIRKFDRTFQGFQDLFYYLILPEYNFLRIEEFF